MGERYSLSECFKYDRLSQQKRQFSFKRHARAGCTSQAIFQAPHLILGVLPTAILEHNRTGPPLIPPAGGSASSSRSLGHPPTLGGGFARVPRLCRTPHHGSALLHGFACQAAADTSGRTHRGLRPRRSPAAAQSRVGAVGAGTRYSSWRTWAHSCTLCAPCLIRALSS